MNEQSKEADELPLHDILIYRMKELYKESKERYGDEFEVDQKEMIEFTNDGFAIIDEFLKRKGSHFKKKDTELVGIEMNLNYKLPKEYEICWLYGCCSTRQENRSYENY